MVVELYSALRQAGVDEQTAEAAARAVWQPEQPATKSDLADLRTEIAHLRTATQTDIASLRADTKADIASLRTEMEAFRGDLARLESRLTWRMFAMTTLFVATVSALRIFG